MIMHCDSGQAISDSDSDQVHGPVHGPESTVCLHMDLTLETHTISLILSSHTDTQIQIDLHLERFTEKQTEKRSISSV